MFSFSNSIRIIFTKNKVLQKTIRPDRFDDEYKNEMDWTYFIRIHTTQTYKYTKSQRPMQTH